VLLADGVERAMRGKTFELLRHLAENAGRLVDREEIIRAVWPDMPVTDDNVANCIREIRRALDDDLQRLLRTLPRRGYLFAATVVRGDAATLEPPITATSAARATPRAPTGRPMVVVLPFDNIGGDPEQSYFTDGLTADLVTDLTRFQSMHVVSPRRTVRQRSRGLPVTPWSPPAPPPGAGYLVHGSVRRAGARIRVTVQLEDARSGIGLWADRFDRPIDDLFAVQEELAEHLASYLVSHVEHEGTRRARRHPPASLDAYDLCLRGRELYHRSTEADTIAAHDLFARAIALEPDYAAAYAWQAFTVGRGMTHLWGEQRGRAAASAALDLARRAVAIEPDSPLCLSRLAFILLLNARWDEALATGRAAVSANPSSGETRLGLGDVLVHAGDPAEAVSEIRLALALDPFHPPTWRAVLGRGLLLSGRPDDALVELQFCATRLPDYTPGLQMLVVAAAETGRMPDAYWALKELQRLAPELTQERLSETWFFRDQAVVERLLAAYRLCGLAER
jgi:adenylate cyclase